MNRTHLQLFPRLPYWNLIGICLQIRGVIMRCIYHSFNLCLFYACSKFPRIPEDLTREIYYFHTSAKHSEELKEFQVFVEVAPHKLLHPSQTC